MFEKSETMGNDSKLSVTTANNEINQLFALSGCKTLYRVTEIAKDNDHKEMLMLECLRNDQLCNPRFETIIYPNKSQIVMFATQMTESKQPTFDDVEQFLNKLSMLDSREGCDSRGLCFKFDTCQDRVLIHNYVAKLFDSFKISSFLTFCPPNDGTLFYVVEIINPVQDVSQTDIRPSMEEVLVTMLQNYKPEPVYDSSWSAYKGYVINHEFCFVKLGLDISCINGKISFVDYTKPIPGVALAKSISNISDKLPESASKESKTWFFVPPKLITDSFSIDLSQVNFFFRNSKNPNVLLFHSNNRFTEVFQTQEIPLFIIHKIIDFFVARKEKEQSARNDLTTGF